MLRPTHFLSTAVMAAFVMSFLDAAPHPEQTSVTAKPAPVTVQRALVSANTISNTGPSQPVQPQRWVF